MPNVKKGSLCIVKCPKHLQMRDKIVVARRRAFPGEVVPVEGAFVRAEMYQWICDGTAMTLFDVDGGPPIITDKAPLCEACLFPIDDPTEGVEDKDIRDVPVPSTEKPVLV